MPAAIDIARVVAVKYSAYTGGSLSGMCVVPDNMLIAIEWNQTTGLQVPSSITYNSVGMSLFASANDTNVFSASIWYLANPPVGNNYTLAATYNPSGFGSGALGFMPCSGVNLSSPFGTTNSGHSFANNNGAVSLSGASASDLYLAICGNGCTSQSSGSGQSNIWTETNIGSGFCASADQIQGQNAGSFSWSNSGSSTALEWLAFCTFVKGQIPPSSYAIDEQTEF